MTSLEPIWLGADPGGRGAFGAAVVQGASVTTALVSCVDEAVAFFRHVVGSAVPAAAGIDAPLWWSSRPSGARKVDVLLRRRYGLSGGAVQGPNSLRGAAVVQAPILVARLREWQPAIAITEAHPKAVLVGVFGGTFSRFADALGLSGEAATEHERDAVVGAVAAREGHSATGSWRHDLSVDRYPEEQDPKTYWLAPVSYCWPEAL